MNIYTLFRVGVYFNDKNILTAASFKGQNQLQKTVLEQAVLDERNLI